MIARSRRAARSRSRPASSSASARTKPSASPACSRMRRLHARATGTSRKSSCRTSAPSECTPMAGAPELTDDEMVRTVALARLILGARDEPAGAAQSEPRRPAPADSRRHQRLGRHLAAHHGLRQSRSARGRTWTQLAAPAARRGFDAAAAPADLRRIPGRAIRRSGDATCIDARRRTCAAGRREPRRKRWRNELRDRSAVRIDRRIPARRRPRRSRRASPRADPYTAGILSRALDGASAQRRRRRAPVRRSRGNARRLWLRPPTASAATTSATSSPTSSIATSTGPTSASSAASSARSRT